MKLVKRDDKGRRRDLEFLEKLRKADLAELAEMQLNHRSKKVPPWKRIAIDRAIRRIQQPKLF